MNNSEIDAALLQIEDRVLWDPRSLFDRAAELERAALAIGDELLAVRARLCQANARMRAGDVASAARHIWEVHQWAVDHDAKQLTARAHLIWAAIHRHLGDAAQSLEHSVLAVELLDDTATPHMRVWHRVKLADALALAGSQAAARIRYQQAEELAVEVGDPTLLLGVLNNFAYITATHGDQALAQEIVERLRSRGEAYGCELDPDKLDTIGMIEIKNGRYADAERTLLLGIERQRRDALEDAGSLAEYHLTLARAQRGLGAYDRAQASLNTSRALCEERELADALARVHQEQSELHAARGEFAEAFAVHKVFFAAYSRLHSQQREAQARTRQAMFETTEARNEAERFREQARRDPLTGLRNRRYIDEELPGLIGTDPSLTVAIADLDHFKRINDQFSHDVGDQVLMLAAKLLETELAAVSGDGFVARMGGEEFLMVLPGTSVELAAQQLDVIRRAVRAYDWGHLTRGLPVTVSIGVAGIGQAAAPTQAALLSTADKNLYAAKNGGRDRVVARTPGNAWSRSCHDTASDATADATADFAA